MTRSTKLGITSVILLLIALLTLFTSWGDPIAFASVGLSGLFALLAAQQGSRWWLTVPALIVAGISILWWNAAQNY